MSAKIFYDGECPFCTRYVGLINLREAVGPVDLVDLRENADLRDTLSDEGFDLDQGMVVEIDGKRVGGADATHALATMSTSSGVFNRLNRAVFSMPAVSALVYPVLRSGRWFTLFLMGRRTIHQSTDLILSRQVLFGALFALFSLFHLYNYIFAYSRAPIQPDLFAIFASALLLLLRPGSARLLFLLMLISTVSTVVQAPAQSNHTMLRSMLLVGYWMSFIYAMARGRPIGDIFANFTLAGRGALLVMYFYGIFHKINEGFLDPAYSCAAALWDQMLPPMSWIQNVYFDYVGIYATFIIEGFLILALLVPKTRHVGMVGGIAFHMFLALSNFAAYISFTTLTIAIHVLFLSRGQIDQINLSQDMVWLRERVGKLTNKLAFMILLFVGGYAMKLGYHHIGSLCLLPTVLVICFLIIRHGRRLEEDKTRQHGTAAYVIGAFVTTLFFANGAMPYLGLKTAQTVAMFSNLRLEGGVSNHLVFQEPPKLFSYLDDVAVMTGDNVDLDFPIFQRRGFGMIYYDLLARLADHPDVRVSFTLNGTSFENVGAADLQEDIDSMLHHPFVRKFFHFQEVELAQPEPCTQ